jgi:hypothetical protein
VVRWHQCFQSELRTALWLRAVDPWPAKVRVDVIAIPCVT